MRVFRPVRVSGRRRAQHLCRCANEAVAELIDVVVAEIRQMKADGLDPAELRRAKDHLKGSLMLGLESTSSRMSHLARQEMYRRRDRTALDEMLAAIERVTARRRLTPGGSLLHRRLAGRDGAWQRQWTAGDGAVDACDQDRAAPVR